MTNLVCAGFGGQGVLTAGLIIAKTGMDIGKNVVWIPSYGSEMRGGTANCNVKISEEEIASPFIRSIDVLLALNEPSVDKFQGSIAPGGTMIINSSIVKRKTSQRKTKKNLTKSTLPWRNWHKKTNRTTNPVIQ